MNVSKTSVIWLPLAVLTLITAVWFAMRNMDFIQFVSFFFTFFNHNRKTESTEMKGDRKTEKKVLFPSQKSKDRQSCETIAFLD